MAKCPRCTHWLYEHSVEEFSTSIDDNIHPHYGVSCKFEFTPTRRCGCNAGFEYDVVVERRLRVDKDSNPHYCEKCSFPFDNLSNEWMTLNDFNDKPLTKVWRVCDRCYNKHSIKKD